MTHLPNGAPIAAIPEALRRRSQWVLWRLENKSGKPTKVPYTDLKHKARANDPKTWLTFDEAVRLWAANPNGWAGVGYEFSDNDPYTGIDLDTCFDPATGIVEPWADRELAELPATYAEISPSGKGIKLWVETHARHTLGSGKDKDDGQVEIYSEGRFFAVTGKVFEDAPPIIAPVSADTMHGITAREQQRRFARHPLPWQNPQAEANGTGNGAYPSIALSELTKALDRLHSDRWAAYDDWLRIGMALHHWGGGDAHRLATAYALYDQYSKERAPSLYGETAEKWASFGKQNGRAPVTVGTLITWAKEDAEPPGDGAPHPASTGALEDEPATAAPIAATSSFPELPEAATIDEAIGADACPWLDDYIAFSQRWSPRSYDGFHEACGIWLLSTVAARRVMLPLGGERFTNLYVALCARTSLWAKSTAAKIAKELIGSAGLSQLLAPDKSTPQAFLKRLAERVPSDYGKEAPEAQEVHRAALAFAGQRGWWHEEFGGHLAGMMREGGALADFRSNLRILDDCPPSYADDTISRGLTIVKRPYLALLANLTPADLAPHARKGSSLWGDGYFARFAFVTPPAGAERSRERFPDGWRTFPSSLLQPLRKWHEELGIPEAEIDECLDEKGKPTGEFRLTVTPVEPQHCTLGAGVFDAWYRYKDALDDLIDAGENVDLDGSYSRFPDKALRVAMLLASFSNGGRIELSHWARAQQIAEHWRASLHYLIDQLGQSEETPERTREDKIVDILTRRGALTAREVGQLAHISTGEAESILDQLARSGVVGVQAPPQGKRQKRYAVAATNRSNRSTVASVAPSQNRYAPGQQNGSVANNSSSYDATTATVATLPTEDGGGATVTTVTTPPQGQAFVDGDDDRHEELMEMWLGVGNPDAADSEAELIGDLERKLKARKRVDEARAARVTQAPPPGWSIIRNPAACWASDGERMTPTFPRDAEDQAIAAAWAAQLKN